MSADNWAHCPKCSATGEAQLRKRDADIQRSYGRVPVDEFDAARRQLAADRWAFERREQTFREDYEIYGAEDGQITVSYSGRCTKCGIGLDFNETRQIPGLDTSGKNGADT